jgi:hypothetical protein
MPDLSDYDDKYFIDANVYNCPFCKRRHVSYSVFKILIAERGNSTDDTRN